MPDTLTIGCPECGKQFKVPASVAGKKVRCKSCGEVIPVAPPTGGKKTAAKYDAEFDDGSPYSVTATHLGQRCPECANGMNEGDIICLKCGYNTQTRERLPSRKVAHTTGFDIFLWLLPGILSALGIILLIVWDILHILKSEDWLKGTWAEFLSYGAFKLWNVIISLFIIFFAGKFAIRRLILHPMPPEVEIR